jgi:hypothetical protein
MRMATAPARRVRREVRRLAIGIVLAYLLVIAVFYWLQNVMIFPGSLSQGHTSVKPPPGAELVRLPTPEGEVVALFGPALTAQGLPRPDAATRPTVLYFYGNGMSLAKCVDQFTAFRRLGANVLVPDYLGFGLSGGRASEQACYQTADAAYKFLVADPRIDPSQIIIAGWSLGAAVAIDLASREPPAGLVVMSGFTSLVDMGRKLYPFLPVRWLLKYRFDNAAKIGRVKCPTIVAHGARDDLVPYSMSEQLAKAAGGPITRLRIETGGHNDFWESGQVEVLAAMEKLVERDHSAKPDTAAARHGG